MVAKKDATDLAINQVEMFPDLPAAAEKAHKDPMKLDKARVKEVVPDKTTEAFKTISEAAAILALPQYVLRFWETKFKQIKPLKLRGGRRYYRPEDIEVLQTIKHLLYKEGYTIKGARKAFEEMKKAAGPEKPAARKKKKKEAPLLTPQKPPVVSATSADQTSKKQELASLRDELLALKAELAEG